MHAEAECAEARGASTPPEDGRDDDVEADERSSVDHVGTAVDRHYRDHENREKHRDCEDRRDGQRKRRTADGKANEYEDRD
jgi:hypothetical protein